MKLVLSLFPGIGMLDMAFEKAGFTVVRGPDLLWGGDIENFHVPKGVFSGIIGGPPCQCFVRYAALNKSVGNKVAEDKIPEFLRVVRESSPEWFLMENSSLAPAVNVKGYQVQEIICNAVIFGLSQDRKRKFQFGSRTGVKIKIEIPPLSVPEEIQPACLASEGHSGAISTKRVNGEQSSVYTPRRSWSTFCALQGLPDGFLDHSGLTIEGKYKVVGNGVPLPMGEAFANAIKKAHE